MSAEASAAPVAGARARDPRRDAAFRIGISVTGSFALAEALNWDFTFVGPMLAAQMLVKMQRPPTLVQGLALLVIIGAANGVMLLLATSFISAPAVLLLALGLFLTLAYYAQFRGAPDLLTTFLQIATVTIPVFAVVSIDTASGFAATLLQASTVALGTVWGAFAIFPAATDPAAAPQSAAPTILEPAEAARAALCNVLIVMPVLTWYVLDAAQVAVVVLITIVTILRQSDRRQGGMVAAALLMGNLVGGLAAALAYNFVLLGGTLLFFILVCLAASLLFAGRIVMGGRTAPILAVGFGTFILLLGLGISPMPSSSGEAFIDRIIYMLLATGYAVGALAILQSDRDRAPN